MNLTAILAAISAASQFAGAIGGLIEGVKGTMSEHDVAQVRAQLADLRARNDALAATVLAKLDEAAKR